MKNYELLVWLPALSLGFLDAAQCRAVAQEKPEHLRVPAVERYYAVVNKVFAVPADAELTLILRFTPPRTPESQIVIRWNSEGSHSVTYFTLPEGISAQVAKLLANGIADDAETLAGQVKIHTEQVLMPRDKVAGLITAFRNLKISPLSEPLVVLDGTRYQVWSSWYVTSDRFHISFTDPEPVARDREHPLVSWMKTVKSEVERAVSNKP